MTDGAIAARARPWAGPDQRGFTLVELVIVITILGILSALALPRFQDFRREARVASVNALAASIRVAAKTGRGQCVLQTTTCNPGAHISTNPYIVVDGTKVYMHYGWPSAYGKYGVDTNVNMINDLVLVSSEFQLLPVVSGGPGAVYQLIAAPTPANCKVTYQALGITGVSVTPDVSGC